MYIQFNKIKKYQLFTISHIQFEEGWIKKYDIYQRKCKCVMSARQLTVSR